MEFIFESKIKISLIGMKVDTKWIYRKTP